MIKSKQQKLASIPQDKQESIRMDIHKYLKGEIRMLDINIKHEVTPFITQKLMRMVIGFDTKHNQL